MALKKSFYYCFLFFIFLFSCTKLSLPSVQQATPIDLSHLTFGQISQYKAYIAECEDIENTFEFTGDTLTVRVILEPEGLFLEEYLTSYSTAFLSGDVKDTFRYPVDYENGKVVLRERQTSRLFFFYDSDYLPLDFPPLMPTAHQNGCKLQLGDTTFTGNELVQFPAFEFGEIALYNKAAVSCRPITEGDGYLMYDEHQLYLSHTVTTEEFGNKIRSWVNGWCLLKE